MLGLPCRLLLVGGDEKEAETTALLRDVFPCFLVNAGHLLGFFAMRTRNLQVTRTVEPFPLAAETCSAGSESSGQGSLHVLVSVHTNAV